MSPRWWSPSGKRVNPVWTREMRQSARLTRTPVILATLTVGVTLLVATAGGIGAASTEPADVGSLLYQIFFSVAFAVVSCVGPGVGALTVASEKSARTWEALQLTNLSTHQIARGKFAAALTYVLMYVVMLAPIGALPFLFGGVTALEVVLAYLLLVAFAVISVGFGLALSAALDGPVATMLVTVPAATVATAVGYFGLGLGGSVGAAELWPVVTAGSPVWLPSALARVDFDLMYAWLLLYAPAALGLSFCGLCYELTVSSLSHKDDDRTTRLRRWFLISSALLLPLFFIPRGLIQSRADYLFGSITAAVAMTLFALATLFIFCGESPRPSQRVKTANPRLHPSRWRPLAGPGISRSGALICATSAIVIAAIIGAGVAQEYLNEAVVGTFESSHVTALLLVGGYGLAFLAACSGLVVYVRSFSKSGVAPRLLFLGLVFFALVGPWLIMAISSAITGDAEAALWLAAPSPSFVFVATERLVRDEAGVSQLVTAATLSAGSWAGFGALTFFLGTKRALLAPGHERLPS